MKDTITVELTEKEARLIMASLVMVGTMANLGRSTAESLEQYRNAMNLKDKISEASK